jgi:uncharacterized linocin/CFP29 family protein
MIELLNPKSGGGFVSTGNVGQALLANNMDVNVLRPWVGQDGRPRIAQAFIDNEGKLQHKAVIVDNAPATLRRDEWIQIDEAVVRSVRERLRLVADIRGAGLEYRVNGMSKTVLETSTMTRAGRATLSMDPARIGEGDRPEFESAFLPLPICHYDFYFNLREIAVSRNGGSPLDTIMVEEAGISVAEELEQLTVGTLPTYSYAGGTIYGLINFPGRATVSLTDPTDTGWTAATLLNEVLEMRQASTDRKRYGPWVLYVSPDWNLYLDADYSANKGENTVRQRILAVDGISSIRQLDYLTGLQFVLVQMTAQNIRMVIGLDLTTIQWDTIGGMRQNFKVMALMVPQLRTDGDGNSGIVHGSVA